jgi:hypothetical protein
MGNVITSVVVLMYASIDAPKVAIDSSTTRYLGRAIQGATANRWRTAHGLGSEVSGEEDTGRHPLSMSWCPCSAAAITAANKTTTAAGVASLGGSKHPAPKRRRVDVWEQHEAVLRAQQPPTACHLLADTFLAKGDITKLTVAAYRKAKSSRKG